MQLPPAIRISRLNHWFGGGALRKQVLNDINLTVTRGEIVIMNGPSGSGKTTLLTLVGALRAVQEGSLSILGAEINRAGSEQLRRVRRSIGFIFQMHNLIPSLTATRNVQMALALDPRVSRAEAETRSAQMLEAVGLGHRINYLPGALSGGQKQRVAIARALVGNPTILLADEPTASLDKHSGREVVELMQHLAREYHCTIFLVTHDNRILDIADRIVTMEDGRIISGA